MQEELSSGSERRCAYPSVIIQDGEEDAHRGFCIQTLNSMLVLEGKPGLTVCLDESHDRRCHHPFLLGCQEAFEEAMADWGHCRQKREHT